MHPTLAIGIALTTWLVIRHRSDTTRLLVAAIGFVMGWHPATQGSRPGAILVAIAAGAATSVIWEWCAGLLLDRHHRRHETR
jgi:uncharacterized protein (DUF2062 family)